MGSISSPALPGPRALSGFAGWKGGLIPSMEVDSKVHRSPRTQIFLVFIPPPSSPKQYLVGPPLTAL